MLQPDVKMYKTNQDLFLYFFSYQTKDPYLYSCFPKKSSLTAIEHKIVLDEILAHGECLDNGNQMLVELQPKIENEYKEFDAFVKNYFLMYSTERKNASNSECEEILVEQWKKEVNTTLKQNKHFRLESALPLKYHDNVEQKIALSYENMVKESAVSDSFQITKIFLRDFQQRKNKFELLKHYNEVVASNIDFEAISVKKSLNNVDIIATKDVLAKLLSGFHTEFREWNISLDISSEANKNILKLKGLPKRDMWGVERVETIVSGCVKAAMLKVRNHRL